MYKITPLFVTDRNWSHLLLLTPFDLFANGTKLLLSFLFKPIIHPWIGFRNTIFSSKQNRNSFTISNRDQIQITSFNWSVSTDYLDASTIQRMEVLNKGVSVDFIMN